jgi:formyl-CoA transferase
VQTDREWTALCTTVLQDPDLAGDPRFARNSARVAHRDALHEVISARVGGLGTATVVTLLDRAGVAHARLNTMPEFLAHPVLSGRDRWRDVGTPGGPVRALLPPLSVGGAEARMGPVPSVGEHSVPILRSLGRTDEQIARLRSAGVI